MSTVTSGPLRPDERDDAVRLLRYAFPNRAVAGFAHDTPAERTFAVRCEGALASIIFWRRELLLLSGEPVPIALVHHMATHPAFRRRGLLAARQEEFLDALRIDGCALAGMETPITRLHRRNGWDIGSSVLRYYASPEQMRPVPEPADGGPQIAPPRSALQEVHRAAAAARSGFLHRDARRWGALLEAAPGDLRVDCVLWRAARGAPAGYAIYRHRRDPAGAALEIMVSELLALTASAYIGLLRFLAEHNNVARLRWDAPTDDPLRYLVREPHQLEPRLYVDKLVRVLDVSALSLPVQEADSGGADGLLLAVEDEQIPQNRGPWRVRVADGRLSFETADRRDEPRCAVRANALGPLLARHLSADAGLACGLVSARDGEAVARLRCLIGTGPAPYCPDEW